MNRSGRVGVGVVGAGNISEQYLGNLTRFPDLDVRFVADLDPVRARAQAGRFGVPGAGSLDELLADPAIEIVVNLTVPAAHVEVGLRVLESGRHLFGEKPFALDLVAGRRLLDRAKDLGLRAASAPDTFLGPGLQTSQRLVDDGAIGRPLTALAQFQASGPESWHPNPEFFFAPGAGPLFDMGPYYLTALVQLMGPVSRVSAAASTSRPTRVIGSGPRAGVEFPVRVPTYHAALLEFRDGGVGQVAFSFQAPRWHPPVVEVAGTAGAIALPDPNGFAGTTLLWTDDPRTPAEVEPGIAEHTRGIGVVELARAIRAGVPERASGDLGFHVLEVMAGIASAAASHGPVAIVSTVEPAPVLSPGWDPGAATLTTRAAPPRAEAMPNQPATGV
ncbi:Gfo/Idh/MocA family protein [Jiangella anatolica]|uniref:Oxidoreductase n=1 Tax=Jiangella anatolica TaxID=2670374 RepID=A0A2W2C2Z8_9ACTN|nr:Gfo/Idh/MocA family oxidoreductase [Jiangella anatolica]PZF82569.1 oxidoreductase [Jiangella anatolica]